MEGGVRFLLRSGGALALVAAVTAVDFRVLHFNSSAAGFTYLLLILFISTSGKLPEAILASFAAVLCYDFFFLPPIFQFTIGVEEDWIALFGFLITAVTASELSTRARRRADEAGRAGRRWNKSTNSAGPC